MTSVGLIAGWAHEASSLGPLAERLSSSCHVHQAAVGDWAPDFVGGLTRWVQDFPAGEVCLIGWSMGALVLLDALRASELPSVRSIVLLAGTARFTATDGYPHGCAPTQLRAMQRGLKSNIQDTLRDFFTLAARSFANKPQNALTLRLRSGQAGTLQTQGSSFVVRSSERSSSTMEQVDVLNEGLEYLRNTDLRADMYRIRLPALCWHGAEDQVIPVGASRWLSDALPAGTLVIHPEAGHDGPTTHADAVHAAVLRFLDGLGL